MGGSRLAPPGEEGEGEEEEEDSNRERRKEDGTNNEKLMVRDLIRTPFFPICNSR